MIWCDTTYNSITDEQKLGFLYVNHKKKEEEEEKKTLFQ